MTSFCLGNNSLTPEEYHLEQKHEIFTRFFVSKIVKLDGKLGDLQDKGVKCS